MEKKVVFKVTGMYCSNCVMHLEALEDEIVGILTIQGSYQKQSLAVEYDETLTDEAQICAAIVELGYTAE